MDRALPFIEGAVEAKKPFLAVIWFHTPHSPVVGGPKDRAAYAEHLEHAQHYYACLSAMDAQMGRLRERLKQLGASDNTMLWFCSDNGPARQGSPRHVGSNGGLSGYKLSIKEGGIRVPGLLVWPAKIKKPRQIAAPCVTSDYFPTILQALGVPLPEGRQFDGINLWPLIEGHREKRGSAIGFLNKEGKEAVWMEDELKLVVTPKGTQLFHIPDDPAEKSDLSKERGGEKKRLRAELEAWKAGVMEELARVPK